MSTEESSALRDHEERLQKLERLCRELKRLSNISDETEVHDEPENR